MIEILPTDQEFKTSPDAGHPDCICSRCKQKIKSKEIPLRLFSDHNTEYRYCDNCQKAAGISFAENFYEEEDNDDWDGEVEEED